MSHQPREADQLARDVRDALTHLHDLAALQTHPLARLVPRDAGVRSESAGRALHRWLVGLLDELKARPPGDAAEHVRGYRLLIRRYGDGLSAAAVRADLAIGESEYYREHRRAIAAVASLVRERSSGTRPEEPVEKPVGRDPMAVRALPAPLNALIGRERELAQIREALKGGRLLTLTGPPGVGKTRLALAAAARALNDESFENGVFFAPLAPISDSGLVCSAIASALGVALTADQIPLQVLIGSLTTRRSLLVLDNFEHVVEASVSVAELAAACPRLTILATSREPLRVSGEQEFLVPPLTLPEPGESSRSEAVRLFTARARAVAANFALDEASSATVAAICRRLDGLPLAIELAAARIRLFSPEDLLARLDRRLSVLTGGARDLPPHQRTLRATIDWSYDLLSESERALFRHLALFAGAFTLEAAESAFAATADMLESLVTRSLVQRSGNGFAMLATLREYGLERLAECGEDGLARRRHAAYFVALAIETYPHLMGGPRQRTRLDQLDRAHDDVRVALGWCIGTGAVDDALQLVYAIRPFWYLRGHYREGLAWAMQALELPGASPGPRARGLLAAANLAEVISDWTVASQAAREAIALARGLGDQNLLAACLLEAGATGRLTGDPMAEAQLEEALTLARAMDDERHVGPAAAVADDRSLQRETVLRALQQLGEQAFHRGDTARAQALYEESLAIARRDQDIRVTAFALDYLGRVAHDQGDLAVARTRLAESADIRRAIGHRGALVSALIGLALVARDQGDRPTAWAAVGEALAIHRELGWMFHLPRLLEACAELAASGGETPRAVRLAGAAAGLRDTFRLLAKPDERRRLEGWLPAARSVLGSEAAAIEAEGRALRVEPAIAYALGEHPV